MSASAMEVRTCERCDAQYLGPPRMKGGFGPVFLCWSCCMEVADFLGVDPAVREEVTP